MSSGIPRACLALILASSAASADDDFAPHAMALASYSDNVDRALTDKKSDVMYAGNVGLTYRRETAAVSADVDANYFYYGYVDKSFPSQGLPGLSGILDYRFVPQVFNWYTEDEYGQVANRPFGEVSPATREDVNYFTSGPTLRLALGQTNAFNLSALYSNSYYSESDIDSERYTGALQLLHLPSDMRSISLNATHTAVRFKESQLYTDYDLDKAFLRIESNARRTTLSIEAGAMSTDNGVERKTQPLLGVTAYRLVGAFSTIGADYRQGFSDSSESFRFDERGAAGMGDQDVLVQASAFRERRASTFVSLDKPRTFGRVSVFYSDEEYTAVAGADRNVRGADFELGYLLTSKSSLKGYSRYERLYLPAFGEHDTDKLFGLEFQQQLSRSSGLAVVVERYDRNSNINPGFAENRVTVMWRYQPRMNIKGPLYDPYRGRGLRQPVRSGLFDADGAIPSAPGS